MVCGSNKCDPVLMRSAAHRNKRRDKDGRQADVQMTAAHITPKSNKVV